MKNKKSRKPVFGEEALKEEIKKYVFKDYKKWLVLSAKMGIQFKSMERVYEPNLLTKVIKKQLGLDYERVQMLIHIYTVLDKIYNKPKRGMNTGKGLISFTKQEKKKQTKKVKKGLPPSGDIGIQTFTKD